MKEAQPKHVTVSNFGLVLTSKAKDLRAVAAIQVNETTVSAASMHVTYGPYTAQLDGVEVPRDLTRCVIKSVMFPEGLTSPDGRHTVHPILDHVEVDLTKRAASIGDAYIKLTVQDQPVELTAERSDVHLGEGDMVSVQVAQLEVKHPWLSSLNTHFQRVGFEVHAKALDQPFDLHVDQAALHLDPQTWQASGDEECQTWVDALPSELHVGPLTTVKFTGRLAFSLGLRPKPFLTVKGSCTSTCATVTEPHHRFSYITYDEKGQRSIERRTTGPDLKDDWVPLAEINDVMPLAVMNMEDFGFRSHHGFLPAALEQSFIEDVSSGKFQRGGSTITMQTAKNLWLSREKTIGRKVDELFLSQVLESCFTKNEIMELYLNIVEFGPNVYGVRQAASHYFQSEPMHLDPREAFYLAWILPRPRKAPPPNADTMARMASLMTMLSHQDRIPETMMLGVEAADTQGWEQP
jgi:hypothetical protein